MFKTDPTLPRYGIDRIQVNPDFDGKAIRTSRAVDLARMR